MGDALDVVLDDDDLDVWNASTPCHGVPTTTTTTATMAVSANRTDLDFGAVRVNEFECLMVGVL